MKSRITDKIHGIMISKKPYFKQIAMSLFVLSIMLVLGGCFRGRPSEKPPIHVNPNMDSQEKYKAQSESRFFENGASMRLPIAGTIAQGELRADIAYYEGKDADGQFLKKSPVPVTMHLLERGRERFNIFCSPCHGQTGDGQGIVVKRGYMPPPTFHQDLVRNYPDGHIYNVITNGIRNMPSYKQQVPVQDRWAIVAYVRALQRSQNASVKDVPPEILNTIK